MKIENFKNIPALGEYIDGADHVDVMSGEAGCSLLEFVASMLSYRPAWMRLLWQVRIRLLRLLGQGEREIPERDKFTPQTLPVSIGESTSFFTVTASDKETYWVAVSEEDHLGAAIGVVSEPRENGIKRFHVITVVRYRNWVGPLYFNIIRPFHYLVVGASIRSVQSRLKP